MVETRTYSPKLPELIQGGMGVGVSSWELAQAVALAGKELGRQVLGVVSGTGLPILMVDRLRHGDPHTIRALHDFPIPEIAQEVLDRYPEGSKRLPPKPQVLISGTEETKKLMTDLLVVANFVEVWLAKEEHKQPIGINYLEKIQITHLPEIYGAMLAGVDYVLMGAGIPNQIPGVLDKFTDNQQTTYKIDVEGLTDKYEMSFDPSRYVLENVREQLKRPKFFAIVSSHVLAQALANKVGGIDGFVVEGSIAGGHNAPARGKEIGTNGEPVYGEKDKPNLDKILELGLPFWLAGGFASPEGLREAQESGAAGIQVGSAFAISKESGFDPKIKDELKREIFYGSLVVFTNPTASPTGFPFQVAQIDGTLSDPEIYAEKNRLCPFGYLAKPSMHGQRIVFRCSAEPVDAFVRKGGKLEETEGRQCLCVGLVAAAGHGRDGDPAIVTFGKDHSFRELMESPDDTYSAADVIRHILGE